MKQRLNTMILMLALSICFVIFGARTAQAATYTVDTTDDNGALTACTSAPNDCSLRGAISSAPAGTDINFSVTGTITLTGGEIAIAKDLTIIGPASAPGITISGNYASRIFTITSGTVNLSTMTLSGGNGRSGIVDSNSGAAVYNSGGTLTIANSTLTGNSVQYNGGAVFNKSKLTVVNSTFSGNSSSGNSGGAIYSYNAVLTVANSTFSGNQVNATGGAIWSSGTLDISNTIVAGNGAGSCPDLFSNTAPTGDYNLVQTADYTVFNAKCAVLSANHNITGQPASLGELTTANGGPTATMALLQGSLAINSGDPNFDTAYNPYDQRGAGYPRKNSSAIDIGAFESAFTSRPPVATNASLYFYLNTASSAKLTVSSGEASGTLTYSIVTGTLPNGLTLDPTTGIISGTTTAYSTGTITFKATDGNGVQSNTATATINVVETPSLIVNTKGDTTANDGVTSLREAVAYANSGSAGANPVITFSVTGVIEVQEPTLSISRDMTITGPGAGILAISGNNNDGVTHHATSIFSISSGIVGISGLTLRDGTGTQITAYDDSTGTNTTKSYGGAIYMSGGTATISDSTLSGNYTDFGGAIYARGGSLTITGSTISNNTLSAYQSGGGIYIDGGSVTITNTTVSGNTAGAGAGILVYRGTLNVSNSTISGNTAQNYTRTVTITCATYEQCQNPPVGFTCDFGTQTCTGTQSYNGLGAGIFNLGTVNITNSTISGNTAQGYGTTVGNYGGGIENRNMMTIANSTVTGNYGQYGGGILNRNTLNLSNTIVAGNTSSRETPDIYNFPSSPGFPGGTTSGNYNLVQNGGTVTGTNNITGQAALLGPLANNGGPTQTHALLQGSPAIDAGDPNFDTTATPFDQRGAGFARKVGSAIDIGAFEGYFYVVNTLADHDDGFCNAGDCTLREAVKYAASGAVVTFGVTGTITLTQGEIVLVKNVSINGPTTAPGITISGNNQSRIFSVGSTSGSNALSLSNLTLTKGNGVGSANNGTGGAVSSSGTLTVANCTFTANAVTGNGGAIRSSSILTVTNSTFYGNTATGNGGAIQFGNSATITSSTISGNTATGNGGGINNNSGTASTSPVILSNSIVAGNSAPTGPDFNGKFTGGDYNLIQNISGATLSGTHNITGQDPKLDILKNNGGATATMALLSGSPAINAGDPNFDATATPFDQRGNNFARKVGSAIDIGAFEVQPVQAISADLTIVKSHIGNFTQGDAGKTYTITVSNSGNGATSGTVSATDSLPAGLTATAISGSGWSCDLTNLTCTRNDALAANGSYPAITLTVNVSSNASSAVVNTATVSGGGESNTANNTASDPTTINAAPVTYSIAGQITNGGEGLSGVSVALSGSSTAQATTDASGNYSFANLNGGAGSLTVTPSLNGYAFVQPSITLNNLTSNQTNLNFATSTITYEGDVATRPTGDGTVDIFDIITVGNIIAKLPDFPAPAAGGEFQRADAAPRATKGDGSIDVQDLIQMQLYAAALNPLTPASGAAAAVPVSTSTILENPNGGDKADGDKSSRDVFGNQSDAPLAGAATVSAGTTTASGGAAIVPVQLNSTSVAGVQFTVIYDAAKLSIPSLAAITNRAPNTSFTFNNSTPGQLGVVAFQSTAGDVFPVSALLFNINFTIVGGAAAGATPITFGNAPVPTKASDSAANAATITTAPGAVTILGPTAAAVSISGRTTTTTGRGIKNVLIRLTDAQGNVRIAYTSTFGYYRFADVAAGETYVITAKGKQYEFGQPTQVVNVNEDTVGINFTANSR